MSRVFISYAAKDREFVERLAADLQKEGLTVFYDMLIEHGESFVESLSKAIESAQFFLVVMSPEYIASAWAQEELQIGMLREMDKKAFVIPLLISPCQLEGYIAKKRYADFTSDYNAGLKRLLKALLRLEESDLIQTVGDTVETLRTTELQTLQRELREAVDSFQAKPSVETYHKTGALTGDKSKERCFIVMPFGDDDLNIVYEDYVKPVIENECDLICERGDDMFGSNLVMDDIMTNIRNSHIVVADLTRKNANVFYEVGIAHTLGKQVLLLAQSVDDVPFDLRHRRVLLYQYTPRGCKLLEKLLKKNVSAILGKMANTQND